MRARSSSILAKFVSFLFEFQSLMRAASACLLPTDRKDAGQVSVVFLRELSGWSHFKIEKFLVNFC